MQPSDENDHWRRAATGDGAAFLELWRRRHRVRVVDGSVLPWLLVTTTNLALNHGRGMRRHQAFIDRLPRSATPAEQGGTAPTRIDLDIDPELLAGIRRLRAVDQQLLALVALEEYRLAEAAEALGMTEDAARSRWQRIRRRLATDHTTSRRAVALDY